MSKDFEKKKKEEIERILNEIQTGGIKFPEREEPVFSSREYRKFKEEEKGKKLNFYEKLCGFSEKIIRIDPGKKQREKLNRSIAFAHLNITPQGAYSFAVLAGILLASISIILTIFSASVSFTFLLVLLLISGMGVYFLADYPNHKASIFRVKASSEIILAVIYMVIYMRSSPNLEGAIKFASNNLTGPLAYDFKKILWDVETRKYNTIDEALVEYLDRWKGNEEFIESIQTLKNSMNQSETKRNNMLDESVNIIMKGSEEKMRSYSQKLQMPMLAIHALGVMLPMLVLIMFPIVILLLSETIKPIFLVIGYDVVLPLLLFFVGKRVLEMRPLGFSPPDISLHPKYSPIGKLKLGEHYLPVWPLGLITSGIVLFLGIYFLGKLPPGPDFDKLSTSLIITWGIGLGPAIYFILDSTNKLKLRNQIRKMQNEFSDALFNLGNRLSLGKPMESVMKETAQKSRGLSISDLFEKALRNLREGMTLRGSFFDKKFGAIWNYPSKIIINVIKIVVDATKKGSKISSLSTISIGNYLKRLHKVEKDLKESLSSTTTSMQFLAFFLAPLISGITVTMAAIMMRIFQKLGESMQALQTTNIPMGNQLLIGGWGGAVDIISLAVFQLVVGIYVIEVAYLLSVFSNGIENGPGDVIAQRNLAGWTIFISLIVYSISMLFTYEMFGTPIEKLLAGGAI